MKIKAKPSNLNKPNEKKNQRVLLLLDINKYKNNKLV